MVRSGDEMSNVPTPCTKLLSKRVNPVVDEKADPLPNSDAPRAVAEDASDDFAVARDERESNAGEILKPLTLIPGSVPSTLAVPPFGGSSLSVDCWRSARASDRRCRALSDGRR
jgi:hypothetical protein